MKMDELKTKTFDDMLYFVAHEASKELIDEMPLPKNVVFSDKHKKKMHKLFTECHRKERKDVM